MKSKIFLISFNLFSICAYAQPSLPTGVLPPGNRIEALREAPPSMPQPITQRVAPQMPGGSIRSAQPAVSNGESYAENISPPAPASVSYSEVGFSSTGNFHDVGTSSKDAAYNAGKEASMTYPNGTAREVAKQVVAAQVEAQIVLAKDAVCSVDPTECQ